MIFDVNVFRSQGLPLGGARPSLFAVFIPTQFLGISGIEADNPGTFQLNVSAASLPMSQMTSIDVYYQGRAMRVAGERAFQPWNITVYNDEDFALRDFLESWSNMINSFEGNIQQEGNDGPDILASNGGYKLDQVYVEQYSRDGGLLRAYEFWGMYPEVIGEVQLNWEQGNRIETFDVRFAYDYWVPSNDQGQAYPATYLGDTGAYNVPPPGIPLPSPGAGAGSGLGTIGGVINVS